MLSMYWFGIPWGGTFAGRTSDLRKSGLVDRWRKSLAVDGPIYNSWRFDLCKRRQEKVHDPTERAYSIGGTVRR